MIDMTNLKVCGSGGAVSVWVGKSCGGQPLLIREGDQ